ncbi:MAG: PorT family protein [Rikenellaceae bacterium]|nr:PorT family protein [Rikenellaceae bacterium]
MNDKFEDILKRKLEGYSIEPVDKDWEIIERRLGLIPKKRNSPVLRYAAAALIIGAMFTGMFFLLRNDAILDNIVTEHPTSDPDSGDMGNSMLRSLLEIIAEIEEPVKNHRIDPYIDFGRDENMDFTPVELLLPPQRPQEANDRPPVPRRVTNRHNPPPPSGFPPNISHPRDKDWSISVYADGSLGGNNFGLSITGNNLLASRSAITSVNMSYANTAIVETTNYDHSMPISAGAVVRKLLNDKWGVETGISYTFLHSKAETENYINYKIKQSAHYIGVPLSVTYSILKRPSFELYAKAGGEANFNVRTHVKHEFSGSGLQEPYTENFSANGIQWSVSGNIGIMYNISPVFGIYFEPGYSHFFSNSRQPDTYWQDHPDNFNMRIGFRTNF